MATLIFSISIFNSYSEKKHINQIVTDFIEAEYSGNSKYLISVSTNSLQKKILNSEIMMENGSLDKIYSIEIFKKYKNTIIIKATISAYDKNNISTYYYEFMTIKHIDGKWYFDNIERDT